MDARDGDDGSETETDDEIYERQRVRKARAKEAAPIAPEMAASVDVVDPINEPMTNKESESPQDASATAVAGEAQAVQAKTSATSTIHTTSGHALSRILSSNVYDSDDDEPPRFDLVPKQINAIASDTQHAPLGNTQLQHASPTEAQPSSQASVKREGPTAPSSVSQSMETSVDPVAVLPTSSAFISPFSSLATVYRPPPPPVVGAPPATYVPLPVGNQGLVISCCRCTRKLPHGSLPVPQMGFGSCVCCGRYYQESSLKTAVGYQYCAVCVQPAAPSQSASPPSQASALDTNAAPQSELCATCRMPLIKGSQTGELLECTCCKLKQSVRSFSKKQRKRARTVRRCLQCIRPLHEKSASLGQIAASTSGKSSKQPLKNKLSVAERKRADRQRAKALSPADAVLRSEMEAQVHKIKLVRRSIERRRHANDLRGSTRLEYEEQLRKEDEELTTKMMKVRSMDPKMFDEVNRSIKVISAIVPRGERDNAGKKKKTSPKKPTKSTQPNAPKRAPKRKATSSTSGQPPKKTVNATGVGISIPRVVQPPVKAEARLKSEKLSSESPPRVISTRARARANRPPEIIDLVDDSD